MTPFELRRPRAPAIPLVVSIPHTGTRLPAEIAAELASDAMRRQPMTDWHLDRLYDFLPALGVTTLVAVYSRFIVDLNRPPDDAPLYDRATTRLVTGVVPLQTFDGQPAYQPGEEPDPDEMAARIREHWEPYHAMLRAELERIRARHGHAVLLDAHSIRHELPLLFAGTLPDLNLGSNGGHSAAASLIEAARLALAHDRFSLVVDGRFRGGYITRHYGRPGTGVHALQLELAQRCYMQETPPRWMEKRSSRLRPVLRGLVRALSEWNPDGG